MERITVKNIARLPNLTQYERLGADRELNLTDGHAHQSQNSTQRKIVKRLNDLYLEGETVCQRRAEAEFQEAFYALAGQHSAVGHSRTALCYSASQAVDITATFLSEADRVVGLLQPCFDNLAAILRRRGVPLVPIAEGALVGTGADVRLRELLGGPGGPGALFVTLPNNPTGFALGPEQFELLAWACAETDTILVIDWTFRFFDSHAPWDQYAVLERTGVSYICIEDSGKTWPTLDLKCSILAASPDLYPSLVVLHNDLLLNVSPFALRVLKAYLDDSRRHGMQATVSRLISANRRLLHESLRGSVLIPGDPRRTVSVEWVYIRSAELGSLDIVDLLGRYGVGILPGDHFYWHDPDVGARFVRFALARDTDVFAAACDRLRAAIAAVPELRSAGDR